MLLPAALAATTRHQLRQQHSLAGGWCYDFLAALFCAACTTCQLARELQARQAEREQLGLCASPAAPPTAQQGMHRGPEPAYHPVAGAGELTPALPAGEAAAAKL